MSTKQLARLIAAAEAYGDAKSEMDLALRAWQPGQPSPRMDRDAEAELKSAARAFATSTRKKREESR